MCTWLVPLYIILSDMLFYVIFPSFTLRHAHCIRNVLYTQLIIICSNYVFSNKPIIFDNYADVSLKRYIAFSKGVITTTEYIQMNYHNMNSHLSQPLWKK